MNTHCGTVLRWHASANHSLWGWCIFPHVHINGQAAANAEVCKLARKYSAIGHVVVGGDFNAHTRANGDQSPVDAAGRMLMDTASKCNLFILNKSAACSGEHSRVRVFEDGSTQRTTIDYVLCSSSALPYVRSLVICEDAMGSDHRPLVLKLSGLRATAPEISAMRVVWKTEEIKFPPWDWTWVNACQAKFKQWVASTKESIVALDAVKADNDRMADILDWSFQRALEEEAVVHVGKKKVNGRSVPMLDAATRLLIQQKQLCESAMKQVMSNKSATEEVRAAACREFIKARKAVAKACKHKRAMADLAMFRDVEEKQGDSKLFWRKMKTLRASVRPPKAPPPVVENDQGEIVTDPVAVLKAWRDFCAKLASKDLTGSSEEGMYDDEYMQRVEERLARLRAYKE